MTDRTGEVYECLESGEIFVILDLDRVDVDGDPKWRALIIHPVMRGVLVGDTHVGEIATYSDTWFSDSCYGRSMIRY